MTTASPPTVLIVEDERDLANLYAKWLDTYDLRTVYDGEEALDRLDETVDIVLLDRRMPGLSGDEVLETIVTRDLSCRVAMVTAVEPDFDIIDMGFDDYVVKPVTEDDLRALIDRLLKRTRYDTQLDRYTTLVAKKAALEAEKPAEELRASHEFATLEARIEKLRGSVDTLAQEFDQDDVAVVLRDGVAEPQPQPSR